MPTASVSFSTIAGTQAALGRAGGHCLVADRPAGRAGGQGLGFNGAELLGLAVGGCLTNDLRYVAHDMGVPLDSVSVDVRVEMEGDPLLVTGITLDASCRTADGSDPAPLLARALGSSTISNSITRGIPVSFGAVRAAEGSKP